VIVKASTFASSDVTIPVHVIKPPATQPNDVNGPWPVVIFSHGRPGSIAGRAALKAPIQPFADMVRFWHDKGYAVVTAVRPGYGDNTKEDPEDHGARWDGSTCSGPVDFSKTANAAAHAVRSVYAWVVAQSWSIKERIVLVGQSVGGLATVTACSQSWPGVMGCINFVGGAGGNPQSSSGASCQADRLAKQFAIAGKTTKVPSLWLYSANDKYWGEQAPKEWHKAHSDAASETGQSGKSEYFAAPPVGDNGHALLSSGSRIWIPVVDAWLKANGL
jgi:dienelactone hydrolase